MNSSDKTKERMDILLRHNTESLHHARKSRIGRLRFFTDRQMKHLYEEFLQETDPERQLDLCTEALNRYDQTFLRRMLRKMN